MKELDKFEPQINKSTPAQRAAQQRVRCSADCGDGVEGKAKRQPKRGFAGDEAASNNVFIPNLVEKEAKSRLNSAAICP